MAAEITTTVISAVVRVTSELVNFATPMVIRVVKSANASMAIAVGHRSVWLKVSHVTRIAFAAEIWCAQKVCVQWPNLMTEMATVAVAVKNRQMASQVAKMTADTSPRLLFPIQGPVVTPML